MISLLTIKNQKKKLFKFVIFWPVKLIFVPALHQKGEPVKKMALISRFFFSVFVVLYYPLWSADYPHY